LTCISFSSGLACVKEVFYNGTVGKFLAQLTIVQPDWYCEVYTAPTVYTFAGFLLSVVESKIIVYPYEGTLLNITIQIFDPSSHEWSLLEIPYNSNKNTLEKPHS
jgi:hypothetical protein